MAEIAKLKKKAGEFEAEKRFDRAIALYREILDVYDSGADADVEVALYNRVGDLLMRQGETAEAVTLYERAVDLYAEGGFFNNAIALCGKVLRTSPGRASVYYKLGKILAAKGFISEARKNFLEYADRMKKAGDADESFRALKEFVELCPDLEDIRLILAEQLLKVDRTDEAIEQLASLLDLYHASGRTADAEATRERILSIDPSATLRLAEGKAHAAKPESSRDLIFIDVNSPPAPRRRSGGSGARQGTSSAAPTRTSKGRASGGAVRAIDGLETTSLTAGRHLPRTSGSPAGFEATALTPEGADEAAPMTAGQFAALDLSGVGEVRSRSRDNTRDLALPGALPAIGEAPSDERSSGRVSVKLPFTRTW